MDHPASSVVVAASTADRREHAGDVEHLPIASASLLTSEPLLPPNTMQQYNHYSTSSQGNNSNAAFVNAQVATNDNEDDPFHLFDSTAATEVVAEAVPLDPWTKTQTTATALTMMEGTNTTYTTASSSMNASNNNDNDLVVTAVSSSEEEPQPLQVTPVFSSRLDVRRQKLAQAMREDPFHKKYRRRKRRRTRMVVGGASGFIAGMMVFGPLGGVAGAATAAAVVRTASKLGEKRKDRRVRAERERLQEQRNSSIGNNNAEAEPVILEAYAVATPSDEPRRSRRGRRSAHPRSCRTR